MKLNKKIELAPTLTKLIFNDFEKSIGISALADAIKSNSTLTELCLMYTKIGSSGVSALYSFFVKT